MNMVTYTENEIKDFMQWHDTDRWADKGWGTGCPRSAETFMLYAASVNYEGSSEEFDHYAHAKLRDILFRMPLEELPLHINDEVFGIHLGDYAAWRLRLGK